MRPGRSLNWAGPDLKLDVKQYQANKALVLEYYAVLETATEDEVDVYRREGDKLVETWVLIDFPWWLKQQGLDIFERASSL